MSIHIYGYVIFALVPLEKKKQPPQKKPELYLKLNYLTLPPLFNSSHLTVYSCVWNNNFGLQILQYVVK